MNIRSTLPVIIRSASHDCAFGNALCFTSGLGSPGVLEPPVREIEHPLRPVCEQPVSPSTMMSNIRLVHCVKMLLPLM
jgi:hypothetical protein